MKPLIDDLKVLEDTGIELNVAGVSRTIKGKLVTVSADNLSAHDLGGFQRHFNSGRICRTCFIDHTEIADRFVEEDVQLRTPEMHAYHLNGIRANPKNASVYGIRTQSAFAPLQTDVNRTDFFPHDIMHDILEGVIPITVRQVLIHFTRTGSVTLQNLNDSLDKCELSIPSNRPNHLTQSAISSHLSGSASHKFELFLLLPRLLSAHVDLSVANPFWDVYLLLREIVDIVFAPVVELGHLSDLQGLIASFLRTFVEVIGQDKMVPKFHYMLHYPRQIRLLGPLRNLWCMRFEGKHQYFKKMAVVSNNHKNIALTLAKRHQMRQCWELSSDDLLQPVVSACRSKHYKFSAFASGIREAVTSVLGVSVESDEVIAVVSSLSKCGGKLLANKVYVVDVVEEEQVPFFCFVKHIINVRDTWLLCFRLLLPNKFVKCYHAFSVSINEGWFVVRPQELLDPHPVDLFCIGKQLFVNLRYAVIKQ